MQFRRLFIILIMTFVVLVELPNHIKNELKRVCVGLTSADWNSDENLFIPLHFLKALSDPEIWDIYDQLGEIQGAPFTLKIQSIQYIPKGRHQGIISASLEDSKALTTLKKNIATVLKPFEAVQSSDSLAISIKLGTIHKEFPERLMQYLEAYGHYQSSPFNISGFVLAKLHQTPKRSFYTVEKNYPFD